MAIIPIVKSTYDSTYDVLRLFAQLPDDDYSLSDEEYPGIFISRSANSDNICGATILGYQARSKGELQKLLPFFDLSTIHIL